VYRVEPHFTIAFGASGVDDDDYLEHVRKITAALHPITFHCRYAMLGADENSDTSYIFLVPDEGNSALSLLHDRLYSGLLASCLRIDLPYVPHITIGRCSERQKAKELCDELNARPLSIAGSVEALTVALMVDDIIKNLRSFELTARRRLKKLDSRDTLGLKKNLNILVDYDPSWEIAFIEERKLLARVLGEVAQGIEHYGSTASRLRLRGKCGRSRPPYIRARPGFQ
jgi:2'-5' RNA ligase